MMKLHPAANLPHFLTSEAAHFLLERTAKEMKHLMRQSQRRTRWRAPLIRAQVSCVWPWRRWQTEKGLISLSHYQAVWKVWLPAEEVKPDTNHIVKTCSRSWVPLVVPRYPTRLLQLKTKAHKQTYLNDVFNTHTVCHQIGKYIHCLLMVL